MPQTYTLKGLHCANCVEKTSAALKPLTSGLKVTLLPPQATFTPKKGVTLEQLNAALAKVGAYTLTTSSSTEEAPLLPPEAKKWLTTYQPLLVIVGYIFGVALLAGGSLHGFMQTFMAGFFLVFSGFKLLNLQGFATAYATYDLLAARNRTYALAYPFIELALGIAYLTGFAPSLTNAVTLGVMLFSSLGVIKALQGKRKIQCACLGTSLNLPMTTVTVVEDLTMAAMAALMLLFA